VSFEFNKSEEYDHIKELKPLQNAHFCSSSRKAKILTTRIHLVFRGLKFEPDTDMGQEGMFCKDLGLLELTEKG
jgi:hypothetical protein